jgi:HlyD family secretion protein
MKKKLFYVVFIFLVGCIFYLMYTYFRNEPVKTEYKYSILKKGSISKDISASGTINVSETVDVGTQVSGIVSKVMADYNQQVVQGQVIAMIDTISLAALVDEAEANYVHANVQFIMQENEYLRHTELLNNHAISRSEFDIVNANYLSAKARLKSAESQLNRAKIDLKYATITAPINGIVISRNVMVGQTVAANFSTPTLFTIANDLKKMQLQAKIDEADIGLIKKGQSAQFSVDAYPEDVFVGVVDQIRLQPVSIQNVVSYTVIINVLNPKLKLLPGMSANLLIQVDQHKDVFIVPLSAFFFKPTVALETDQQNGNSTIWVESKIKEGSIELEPGVYFSPIEVRKGINNGAFAEIESSSITVGMKVVTGIYTEPNIESEPDLFGEKDDGPMTE